jgi:predicted nucleic acid-binding protein
VIVADANVLVYLVVQGSRTDAVREVVGRDDAWAAPQFWRSEVLSALSGYVRRGDLDVAGAAERFAVAEAAVGGREFDTEPAEVLELAARSGCSTYDCEYVAVALALGVPLVTADKQVLQAFPGTAVSPEAFVAR